MSRYVRWSIMIVAFSLLASPAAANEDAGGDTTSSVAWFSEPCTEPVLFIPTDAENVRDQIPKTFPGTEDEFMENLVTVPGSDGLLATVVITLNTCESSEMTWKSGNSERHLTLSDGTAEVLVMVLYDGGAEGPFEFYTLASYVNESKLAGAFRSLGLPTTHTPNMVFDLDADPTAPEPGANVPFTVSIPNTLHIEGSVIRPDEYGPGGHATQYFDGNRGFVQIDHHSPAGGFTEGSVRASVTVTGPRGSWLADLLGETHVDDVTGMYLEKLEGHVHIASLE